jgi:FkbM family methyltransferase
LENLILSALKRLAEILNKLIRIIALNRKSYNFLFLLKKQKTILLSDDNNGFSDSDNFHLKIKIVLSNFLINFFTTCARYSSFDNQILSNVKIKLSDSKSLDIVLDLNEFTQCNYYFNNISTDLINLIKKLGTNQSIFIDIGANIGLYSLIASKYFKEVVSFEPQPNCLYSIRNHIQINDIDNNSVVDKGVSDFNGQLELKLDPLNQGGASLLKPGGNHKSNKEDLIAHNKKGNSVIMIDITTLDDYFYYNGFFNNNYSMLIKIDVEGHEESVLRGALEVIKTFKPILFIEVDSVERVLLMLSILPLGYLACDFKNLSHIDKSSKNFEFVDIVFYHESNFNL